MKQGVILLLVDIQKSMVHFSDRIFDRDRPPYSTIDETASEVISCAESRSFLARAGIQGEIIRTPSHSEDSISIVLDSGDCFVGDLEPQEHLAGYEDNPALRSDWDSILSFNPRRIFYAHAPEKMLI